MFLTSRMMILNKEKANCAPSPGVHQSSKHQCQGDEFISFKASVIKIVMRAVLVYWKRSRKSLRNFNLNSLKTIYGVPAYYLMASF